MQGRFVSYLRVSTDRQGRSGLGLEGQRKAVTDYLNGGAWTLLEEVVEVETGTNSDRPQLARALDLCKLTGATLLIAKLDRLARNVHFVSGLMETGIPFVAVEMPNATPFMLHVYAAVAEEEAKAISRRTKAALAASKKKLGGWRGGPKVSPEVGTLARQAKANAFAAERAPMIRAMRDQGMSLRQIAAALTEKAVTTPQGGAWTAAAVSNVLNRQPAA